MQAKGHAALGNAQESRGLLAKAEDALEGTHEEVPSEWVSRFDAGSLSSEAARCLRQLGRSTEAQAHAQRIIALRPPARTRRHAFGQLFLISTLIDQGEPEQACDLARDVVQATQSLGSYLVVHQLQEIRNQLSQYTGIASVSETREILGTAVRQRLWLQQWITSDATNAQADAR